MDQPLFSHVAALAAEAGPLCRLVSLGRSLFGRDIPCLFLGQGEPRLLFVAGHHAREYVGTEALLLQCAAWAAEQVPGTLAVVPCANPDGAELCRRGLASAPLEARGRLLAVNGGSDFSLYKANGRGVDLNVNFPAGFGTGRGNVRTAAPHGYIGKYPLSEPENLALLRLVQHFRPQALVTLHTKGNVIYWRFGQRGRVLRRDLETARGLAEAGGFRLAEAPHSAGGLKDFAVQYLGIPAFTVELGAEALTHPVAVSLAPALARQLADFPAILARSVGR